VQCQYIERLLYALTLNIACYTDSFSDLTGLSAFDIAGCTDAKSAMRSSPFDSTYADLAPMLPRLIYWKQFR
jgi:hypothetical protein